MKQRDNYELDSMKNIISLFDKFEMEMSNFIHDFTYRNGSVYSCEIARLIMAMESVDSSIHNITRSYYENE